MKNFFTRPFLLLAAASLAFTACSDDDDDMTPKPDCSKQHIQTVSFETSEGLTDFLGEPVALGDISVVGGIAASSHHRVFWANEAAYADYMQINKGGSTYFDDMLFSTSDANVWFGSYYSDNKEWGGQIDSWYGFALTANYDKSATEVNYANQFKAWATSGANDSKNCALGYYSSYGGTYALPTIELATTPLTVCHCYMANTAITATYVPTVDAATFEYKVTVTGWLNGSKTGSVDCMLIKGAEKVADWKFVDLSALGKVNKLTFTPSSNDIGDWGDNAPAYFAIDEIGFTK